MRRTFGLVGATAGGWLGWYLGAMVSPSFALMASILGSAAGLYVGYRTAARYS